MTYKEKKLKEFDEFWEKYCRDTDDKHNFSAAKLFISITIDEIIGCLPDHTDENEVMILQGENGKFFNHGFNCCILSFLQNLKAKAGEL